jgi:hypothetical protein
LKEAQVLVGSSQTWISSPPAAQPFWPGETCVA